jgi:soluble lytic murein transglycosylase-like protein
MLWNWLFGGSEDTQTSRSNPRSSGTVTQAPSSAGGDKQAFMARLEAQYGLPAGMLDRVWAAESGRGKFMLSPKGAKGDFQFMPGTANEYGVDTNDFYSGATGAARYLRNLLNRFENDPRKAAAAYNWGQGNLAKVGGDISRAPLETRNYADKVAGPAIYVTQTNDIRVYADDAIGAGKAVAREQQRVGADLTRNIGQMVVQ